VFAGISYVTIGDVELCNENDLSAHLFLDEKSIGKNRAIASLERIKELNPHVKVEVITTPLQQIDLKLYDVCCVSGLFYTPELLEEVNQAVRSHTIFIAIDSFGLIGAMFEDLGDNFVYEKKVGEETKRHTVLSVPYSRAISTPINHSSEPLFVFLKVLYMFTKNTKVPPTMKHTEELLNIKNSLLEPLRATANRRSVVNKLTDDIFRLYCLQLHTELSPTTTVLGGITGQEIVKLICRNDHPFHNLFLFNALEPDNMGNTIGCFGTK